jgi:DNA-binding NarL/FixJ family response regulator
MKTERVRITISIHGEPDLLKTPAALLSTQPLVEPLTNREMEILDLLTKRLSNKEIAEKLCISPETVKKHLNNLYGKLNVSRPPTGD